MSDKTKSDVDAVLQLLTLDCNKLKYGKCTSLRCIDRETHLASCAYTHAVDTVKAMRGLLALVVKHGPVIGLDNLGVYDVWLAEAQDLLGLDPSATASATATCPDSGSDPNVDPLGR